jgi:hypothetical protein
MKCYKQVNNASFFNQVRKVCISCALSFHFPDLTSQTCTRVTRRQ